MPPGQYVTPDFPCYRPPDTARLPADWDFTIVGEVDELVCWSWDEAQALPSEMVTVDIHCVTKWSARHGVGRRLGRHAARRPRRPPSTRLRSATAATRRTSRLEDLTGGKAWVAYEYDGEPLDLEHGGPARLLVPHRTSGRAASAACG